MEEQRMEEAKQEGKHLTGLLYYNPERPDFQEEIGLIETPLMELSVEELRPGAESLAEVMAEFA